MRAVPVVVAIAVAGAMGCTFLVQFDDVDEAGGALTAPRRDGGGSGNGDDDGASGSSSGEPDDGGLGQVTPEGGVDPFPPPCDTTFPLAQVTCDPAYPRPECAKSTNIVTAYPAGHPRGGDLVTCNGSSPPTCVKHCPFGCLSMPQGNPDQCDDCAGKADGIYCLKDLRGTDPGNLGFAVQCTGGHAVDTIPCGVGKCATTCPRATPSPSCCI